MNGFEAELGPYQDRVHKALQILEQRHFSRRLWAKDPSLWKSDPTVHEKIKNRLGWLTVVDELSPRASDLKEFSRSIRSSGFSHAVLLGMGGSSLCPEVLRRAFGVKPGYPDLIVLDSTDPATILQVEKSVRLEKTLFIVASKSGTTLEVQVLYRYFADRLKAIHRGPIGNQFIAITDPGSPLEKLAQDHEFRRIFINPPDIGGRYSALSYFGMVPAVLIGMDLDIFFDRAKRMVQCCGPSVPLAENPAVQLGVMLGELARIGRDKMTLLAPDPIAAFGVWLEQLLAESTGKEGKGILPVEGEAVGKPTVYGHDRMFVYLGLDFSPDPRLNTHSLPQSPQLAGGVFNRAVRDLIEAGHPVVRISVREPLDLAGEFFRWEVATAVAGALLGINPFDEPNVTESKENTQRVLGEYRNVGRLPFRKPLLESQGIRLYGDFKAMPGATLKDTLEVFFRKSRASDYVALLAYLDRSHEASLQTLRLLIRDHSHLATTLGFGPRYLHSTGQLHKGGAGNGLFLIFTGEDRQDVPIPGEKYTFGVLKKAQALGDFEALVNRRLRALHLDLGQDVEGGLHRLADAVKLIFQKAQ